MDADLVRERLSGDADDEAVRAVAQYASQMGISGVPTFIIDNKYAVQGAQTAEVFLQVFAKVAEDQAAGDVELAAASGD